MPTKTAQVVADPTPDAVMERMKRDWLAEQLLVETEVIARDIWGSQYSNPFQRRPIDRKTMYVPSYIATACVEETQPTVEGFNAFMRGAISAGNDSVSEAKRAIQTLTAAAGKWESQGFDAATQQCLQPYFFPQSVSDAKPAIDLEWTITIAGVAPQFVEYAEKREYSRASEWFTQAGERRPFITWLCDQDGSGC